MQLKATCWRNQGGLTIRPSTESGPAIHDRPQFSTEISDMDEFVAVVRLPNGLTQRVTIQADDSGKARSMLEAQYGRGCVLTLDRLQKW